MSVADLLRELIRIPSVNPDGDPGTTRTGEKDCANFIADFLRACGAETEVEDVLPDVAPLKYRVFAGLIRKRPSRDLVDLIDVTFLKAVSEPGL